MSPSLLMKNILSLFCLVLHLTVRDSSSKSCGTLRESREKDPFLANFFVGSYREYQVTMSMHAQVNSIALSEQPTHILRYSLHLINSASTALCIMPSRVSFVCISANNLAMAPFSSTPFLTDRIDSQLGHYPAS